MGDLTDLESLSLQENWLTGSIPAALGHLSNLWWLALDRNTLTGSIPGELGKLTQLRHLKLYGDLNMVARHYLLTSANRASSRVTCCISVPNASNSLTSCAFALSNDRSIGGNSLI